MAKKKPTSTTKITLLDEVKINNRIANAFKRASKMGKTYDTECYTLAEHFLSDYKIDAEQKAKIAAELAQEIQDVIEDFLIGVPR